MILVSSCLLGLKTKFDGSDNLNAGLIKFCPSGAIVPACPEQLGGLPTPRPPAEIKGGAGSDVLKGIARVCTNLGRRIDQ